LKHSKTFIVFLILLYCFSCDRKRDVQIECFTYPHEIDSLQIQDLYDSARWYVFTWLCDQREDKKYYYGELELRYNSFLLRNDSLELFFRHYSPDSLSLSTHARLMGVAQSSVAFNINTRKKLWTFNIDGFSDGLKPGDPRFDNPRSPEVLNFIRVHKQSLNSCFVELAKKMNVIE